ncbi:RNA polymerase factor sigma-54 [Paracoccus sp. TOH]|uniref:RNA polymerase factor sigma-54 n=1 Tax=Paracoccus sp. TOH TaxID=1263728 RepID=UPI0025AFEB7F|nr:RNA polymerase factor sigma-54 [Paracoccus sp. TOH]WJS87132.1 RNA polymerase factor sigma-54 [Paracoccus sp. TOH]
MQKRAIQVGYSVSAQVRPLINITPELRQAIALLQMDAGELGGFLAEQAARNPFLRLRLPGHGSSSHHARTDPAQDLPADGTSLIAHVLDQLRFCRIEPNERHAAQILIDALSPSGWLERGLDELAQDHAVPSARLETVLKKLQTMEPTGLFARDLADCLRLQLAERGQMDPAAASVLAALGVLATGGDQALAAETGLPLCEVRRVLALLRQLDPKPGGGFTFDPPRQIVPDLILERRDGNWHVAMNRSLLPDLRVDGSLFGKLGPEARRDMRAAYGTARWIVEAVERRHRTVLRIGAALVHHQSGYFDHGPAGLSPLSQRTVAENLGLSESTVSRVVNSVHLQAPDRIVALKTLFVKQIAPASAGKPLTTLQLCQEIQALLGPAAPAEPLTDSRITQILNERGFSIARRTVAKYRALCGIPCVKDRQRPPSGSLFLAGT